mgnify:CR=1 FL=1
MMDYILLIAGWILVFAKTPFAAKELSRQLTSQGFGKYYRALVEGRPPKPEGILEHYLAKDPRANLSRANRNGSRIMMDYILLIAGFVLLIKGADYFVAKLP